MILIWTIAQVVGGVLILLIGTFGLLWILTELLESILMRFIHLYNISTAVMIALHDKEESKQNDI